MVLMGVDIPSKHLQFLFPNAPKNYFWDHPPSTFDGVVNSPTYPASISILGITHWRPNNEKKKCHMSTVVGQCKKRRLTLSLSCLQKRHLLMRMMPFFLRLSCVKHTLCRGVHAKHNIYPHDFHLS